MRLCTTKFEREKNATKSKLYRNKLRQKADFSGKNAGQMR